jgi:hypothetical protein
MAPVEALTRTLVALDFADVEVLPLVRRGDTLGLLLLASAIVWFVVATGWE